MRAFDLLSNAEQEIRTASHPRYQFEMLLLKWMHTRKLTPLTELLASGGSVGPKAQLPTSNSQLARKSPGSVSPAPRTVAPANAATRPASPTSPAATPDPGGLKDKLLAEIRSGKATFYNTVVACARRIDVTGDRITFVFGPAHSSMRGLFDQQKAWLDAAAERLAGRKMAVVSVQSDAPESNPESRIPNPGQVPDRGPDPARVPDPEQPAVKKRDLKAEAMSSSTVQAMLDVFPAEIRDVEETP